MAQKIDNKNGEPLKKAAPRYAYFVVVFEIQAVYFGQ
jgi:hypothetical protein